MDGRRRSGLEHRLAAIGRRAAVRAGQRVVGPDVIATRAPDELRGRLMWAVELMPVYWQREPTTTRGVGLSPLVWRWRFVPRDRGRRLRNWGSRLLTANPVPDGTGPRQLHRTWGRRGAVAAGVALLRGDGLSIQHISNGNQLTTNPGVNAHVLSVGVALGARRLHADANPARAFCYSVLVHAPPPPALDRRAAAAPRASSLARRYILRVLDDGSLKVTLRAGARSARRCSSSKPIAPE